MVYNLHPLDSPALYVLFFWNTLTYVVSAQQSSVSHALDTINPLRRKGEQQGRRGVGEGMKGGEGVGGRILGG